MNIQQGDIYLAECCAKEASSIIKGLRPVVVVQAFKNSSILHVIPLTTSPLKRANRFHIRIEGHGLAQPSIALIEQLRLIDKNSMIKRLGTIAGTKEMDYIIKCLFGYFKADTA